MEEKDIFYLRVSLHYSLTLSNAKGHSSASRSTLPIFIRWDSEIARCYVMLFNIPVQPWRIVIQYGSQEGAMKIGNFRLTLWEVKSLLISDAFTDR